MTTETPVEAAEEYQRVDLTESDLKALGTEKVIEGVGRIRDVYARIIPESRMATWENKPAPGKQIRELVIEMDPLDCIYFNQQGETFRRFTMPIDNMDGSPKGANSVPGRFRESARKIGFPDVRELKGRTVKWTRGREKFGGAWGQVTRLVHLYRDGEYVPPTDLPVYDYREQSQDYSDAAPDTSAPLPETFKALGHALVGVDRSDLATISKIVRSDAAFKHPFIQDLKSQELLVDYLLEHGFAAVDDSGIVHEVA